jgi:hypothetical protein
MQLKSKLPELLACARREHDAECLRDHIKFSKETGNISPALARIRSGPRKPPAQVLQTHLTNRETGRIFAKKPTCNNAANSQELVGGPSAPIKIALWHHAVTPRG